ncbi:MAG: UDP-N-acetylglucosamine--N-acetylmuramyl-(pentapeptide) pyrophosphoryl-undecaprenol N-acetylglucosamine transferase [Phycisphaerales bacterium]|nr:UDP-N-acetylglucosamine--N-acetylmuramyl-(pentapeptide) pyrophosphoryl-undecaprenol N-acetylglucosamine transferase [Phycisphaerales bacterium]
MPKKVLIAGGGSGGHVAPAIAVAESLVSTGHEVLLAHSPRTTDTMMVEHTDFETISLPAAPLSTNPIGFVRFFIGFIRTSWNVKKILRKQNFDCVLTTGGYVAAPTLHAAKNLSCQTILLNLDNPPGKANRLAASWADRILSTVKCNLQNVEITKPPLRRCVITSRNTEDCKKRLGLDPNRMTLLITGASQGASTINSLVPAIAKRNKSLFHNWQILHIAGTKHVEQVQNSWNNIGIPYVVLGFHHEMGDVWGCSDLAITRGGANTIAEISINSVPTIVMPYPYHNDDHQKTNATPLEDLGGIIIATDHVDLEQNISDAGISILQLMKDHKTRFAMRQAMANLQQPNGANSIALICTSEH